MPTAMQVRCCSDKALPGWVKKSSCFMVWGGSDEWGARGCSRDKTFAEAERICREDADARLCTVAELEGDCTQGAG